MNKPEETSVDGGAWRGDNRNFKNYQVRRLGRDDVDAIYELCRENRIFYRYHEPFVTKESILDDMEALPPGKSREDKYYVGFLRAGPWWPLWT